VTVILRATADRAIKRQRGHDAREGTSRCKECGEMVPCREWTVAEAVIVRYRHQREIASALAPARGRARVPTRPTSLPRRRPPDRRVDSASGWAGAVWRRPGSL
jgi:hypothetical protein